MATQSPRSSEDVVFLLTGEHARSVVPKGFGPAAERLEAVGGGDVKDGGAALPAPEDAAGEGPKR